MGAFALREADLVAQRVRDGHRVAALAAERVYFAPHIEVLEPDHPERASSPRCASTATVDTRQPRTALYDQEEAERLARAMLMPAGDFDAGTRLPDSDLAERLAATLDQVGK